MNLIKAMNDLNRPLYSFLLWNPLRISLIKTMEGAQEEANPVIGIVQLKR
ncbi:hypothetical protein [Aquiflexum sp.]